MSFQSGSRFTSNHTQQSQSSQAPSFGQNYHSSTFHPSTSSNQMPQTLPSAGKDNQPLPFSAHLAPFDQLNQSQAQIQLLILPYTVQQRLKLKAENRQKYNMAENSRLYLFYPRQLESLMVTYPADFPGQLQEQMRGRLQNLRSSYNMFHKMVFGGILYHLLLRNKKWFKLTGNGTFRFVFIFMSLTSMFDMNFQENEYLLQQIFINNRWFEEAVSKYNVNPQDRGKIQLLTY